MRTVGNDPSSLLPAQCSPQEPRLLLPQLTGSARLKTLKNNAMTFQRAASPNEYAARVVFKSNYAANQKRYHISYINTFKDIFLIILFFFQTIYFEEI